MKRSELVTKALDLGLRVERAGNGHFNIWAPSGRKVQISSSPSDKRTVLNDRARLRREGMEV